MPSSKGVDSTEAGGGVGVDAFVLMVRASGESTAAKGDLSPSGSEMPSSNRSCRGSVLFIVYLWALDAKRAAPGPHDWELFAIRPDRSVRSSHQLHPHPSRSRDSPHRGLTARNREDADSMRAVGGCEDKRWCGRRELKPTAPSSPGFVNPHPTPVSIVPNDGCDLLHKNRRKVDLRTPTTFPCHSLS